jgi:aminoglycoside phosphotransferase (APT) family kinase protein
VPSSDEVVAAIGRLLRRAHDAQAGFAEPADAGWSHETGSLPEVIGHLDLFWTNVVFRDGLPAALIDWEVAAPASRTLEVALASTYWAGIRIDEQLVEWGLPLDRRGERLRLLCDAYGLADAQRAGLLDELIAYRRSRLARKAFRGTTPVEVIRANLRWTEEHAPELATFLA